MTRTSRHEILNTPSKSPGATSARAARKYALRTSPVILKTELRRPGCLFNFKIPTRDYGVWGTERKYKVKVKDPDTDTWARPKYTQRATVRNLNSAAPGSAMLRNYCGMVGDGRTNFSMA